MSVSELAPVVGLHANTVRAHLEVLARSGQVARSTEERRTPGRPRELYRATGAGATEDQGYGLLAELLAHHLAATSPDPAAAALDAGRRWAWQDEAASDPTTDLHARTAGIGPPVTDDPGLPAVLRLLTHTGFAPELTADGTRIRLRSCPFRTVADAHPEVVCSAHLGLIRGMLERLSSDVHAAELVPFAEPGVCVAHLEGVRDRGR